MRRRERRRPQERPPKGEEREREERERRMGPKPANQVAPPAATHDHVVSHQQRGDDDGRLLRQQRGRIRQRRPGQHPRSRRSAVPDEQHHSRQGRRAVQHRGPGGDVIDRFGLNGVEREQQAAEQRREPVPRQVPYQKDHQTGRGEMETDVDHVIAGRIGSPPGVVEDVGRHHQRAIGGLLLLVARRDRHEVQREAVEAVHRRVGHDHRTVVVVEAVRQRVRVDRERRRDEQQPGPPRDGGAPRRRRRIDRREARRPRPRIGAV